MKAKHSFNSKDFIFRPTSLGEAMRSAGLISQPALVREQKLHGLLRAKQDKDNALPSVSIHLIPAANAA